MHTPLLGLPRLQRQLLEAAARPPREEGGPVLRKLVALLAADEPLDTYREFAAPAEGQPLEAALAARLENGLPTVADADRMRREEAQVALLVEDLPPSSAPALNRPLDRWLVRNERLRLTRQAAERFDIPDLAHVIHAWDVTQEATGHRVRSELLNVIRGDAPLGSFAPQTPSFTLPRLLDALSRYYGPERKAYPVDPTPGTRLDFGRYEGRPIVVLTEAKDEPIGEYLRRVAGDLAGASRPVDVLYQLADDLERSAIQGSRLQKTVSLLLAAEHRTRAPGEEGPPLFVPRTRYPPAVAPRAKVDAPSRLQSLEAHVAILRKSPVEMERIVRASVQGAHDRAPSDPAEARRRTLSDEDRARLTEALLAKRPAAAVRAAAVRVAHWLSVLANDPRDAHEWGRKLRAALALEEARPHLEEGFSEYRAAVQDQLHTLRVTRGLVRPHVQEVLLNGALLGQLDGDFQDYTLSQALRQLAGYYDKATDGLIPVAGGAVHYKGPPLSVGESDLPGFIRAVKATLEEGVAPEVLLRNAVRMLEAAGHSGERIHTLLYTLLRAERLSRG